MSERQQAHDDRNLARMLTPAERRDKKVKKLFDSGPEASLTSQTCVYRVEDLSHGQHKFKVDVNAQENHMSGKAVLLCGARHAMKAGGVFVLGSGTCIRKAVFGPGPEASLTSQTPVHLSHAMLWL